MIKQSKNIVLIMAFAITTFFSSVANADDFPEGTTLHEVHVLSLQFEGSGVASLVARPCDTNVECDNVIARIGKKTLWRDGHVDISYKNAKGLQWEGAVLIMDKFNNALVLERIPLGDTQ